MTIVLLFFSALFFAYLTQPLCARLTSFFSSRSLASIVSILICLTLISSLLIILAPLLGSELQKLKDRFPLMISVAHTQLMPIIERLNLPDSANLINSTKLKLLSYLDGNKEEVSTFVFKFLLRGTNIILDIIGWVVLVPVTMFYLLRDWNTLLANIIKFVPVRMRSALTIVLSETDKKLRLYIKGQAYTILAMGLFYSTALYFFSYENWLPIGVLSGILLILPYIGFFLATIIALLAGILDLGLTAGALTTLIIFSVGQVIEGFFLTPKLVGETVGLHPLAVIFSIIVFGSLLGFTGLLIAIPVTAIATSLITQAVKNNAI